MYKVEKEKENQPSEKKGYEHFLKHKREKI
jgi:hypothetical protein